MTPRALTFRSPSGLVSPSTEQLVGDGADQVVEGLQGEGVAVGGQVAGTGELAGCRVVQLHIRGGLRRCFAALVFFGVELGGGLGDEPVGDDRSAADPVGELVVDPPGTGLGQASGLLGDASGLPGGDLAAAYSFPELGVAVRKVECVGHQVPRRGRGPAHRGGQGLRCERRHRGCPVATEGLIGGQDVQCRPAGGLDPGVGGGGVQDRPLVGQAEAADLDPAGLDLDGCGFGEHAGGVEVSDLDSLSGCRAHGTSQASTTDSRRPQKPLSTRVLRNCWKNFRQP